MVNKSTNDVKMVNKPMMLTTVNNQTNKVKNQLTHQPMLNLVNNQWR